ncbi:uncharacterized protein VTP21DRAFT_1061 [Calcarisporiella thermophila]|uniref:uncharacterized protein n=1 Tax=Calcarisporiella thermophila TaxID=911321 RepID=UPI0037432DC1
MILGLFNFQKLHLGGTEVSIANFLASQYAQGKSADSCHLYRSAIGELQTSHPYLDSIVSRFLRIVDRLAPPLNLAEDPIDITPILEHLRGTPNTELSLRNLTYKLAWLLAVVTFSSTHGPSVDRGRRNNDEGEDNSTEGTRRNRRIIKPIHVHRFPDPNLCPVECFIEYRRRWQEQDKLQQGSEVFLSITSPDARAHDARKTGATLALRRFNVDTVVTIGNRSSATTFDLYYRRDRAVNADISGALLSLELEEPR